MMQEALKIIKCRYITEKAKMLELLHDSKSNQSIERFKSPKYVFIVDRKANKQQIACAIETIYKEKNIKVTKVNTLYTKRKKKKKRGLRKEGMTSAYKKAIVTMEPGDLIDQI
ncbi:MAG: 50S ribosomal protein L23 [Chlamydiales bacterium]